MGLPSNEEQELLQLVNRLRADPAGEAGRITSFAGMSKADALAINQTMTFFGVNVTAFASAMAAFSPAAPLAWSTQLDDSAATHSALMIANDTQSHNLPNEAGLGERINATGYGFNAAGENIYAFASSPQYTHAGFVVDWGFGPDGMQSPAGHRDSLASGTYQEIGIDITPEANAATKVGPLVVTQHLGRRGGYAPQFVGAVFDDADGDLFYDAGEGKGGVTVTAVGAGGTFSTTTWSSGGWQMAVPAGSYTVTFSGAGLGTYSTSATMGSDNVALDAEAASFGAPPPVASIAADRTISEASVWVTYEVTLDVAPTVAASVRWSLADGSATVADGDMPSGQGGTLAFAPGQASASFTFVVNGEAHKQEASETFRVVLDQPSGVTLGDAEATVTLLDSYVPPPAVPLAMVDSKGASSTPALSKYTGPLSYIDQEFVFLGTDGVVLSAAAPNVFLRSGSGDDAVAVTAGQNVLDAGTGSNFLTGGSGVDTFFLDARGTTASIWSTVVGIGAGDAVTLWGVSPGTFTMDWVENQGADNYKGVTLHALAPGRQPVSLTLAGLSEADRAARMLVAFGTDTASNSDYMYIFARA